MRTLSIEPIAVGRPLVPFCFLPVRRRSGVKLVFVEGGLVLLMVVRIALTMDVDIMTWLLLSIVDDRYRREQIFI